MQRATLGRLGTIAAGLLLGGVVSGAPAAAQELTESARAQMSAILSNKASRTPVERKMTTALLMAFRESRGVAMVQGLPPMRRTADRAHVDGKGVVVVDIKGRVTDALLATITRIGGAVLSSQPAFEAVRAQVPIRSVDAIAALRDVRRVGPAEEFVVNTGSATSQGDVTHAAATVRSTYGVNGTGVKIGVLSDGVTSLAARQATGDLPATCSASPGTTPCVSVVPGQAGSGDEGTAMMEIVADLAPGAQIFFASAFNGEASFAANILALRNTYGCDIIVDDVTYYDEGAFQDGVVAQAVNAVTASGALFFSSAGNSGRLDAGTSGTWEGDFVDSLTTISFFTGSGWQGLPIHSFNGLTGGSAVNVETYTTNAPSATTVKWSDPLGGAVADYDIFLFDSTLTNLWDYSADDQATTLEPIEGIGAAYTGEKLVIVKWSGPARALRVDTNRGRVAVATAGATYGHNGGDSTISVAAASISSAGGGAFTGGTANPVETYSSDGPRRIFFNPDGSAITPGNVLFGTNGGRSLQKPDITAADCVTTTTPGFIPFCGTSAAAPHAAAIAGLLLSASPKPTPTAVAAAMLATPLDVTTNGVGPDRDSGAGIVMADRPEAVADVAVAMTGPTAVLKGADAVFTVTVTNNGLASASSVQVADPAPAGLTFVSNAGDCTTPFPCLLGSLATGASRTITATFNVPGGYAGPNPFVNTVTVSASTPDPIPANNASSVSTLAGQADLSIVKTGPVSVVRGTNAVYTITVSNAGPDAADAVQVQDATPAGLAFVSNSADCTTAFPCALGTIASGATRTITTTLSVPSGYSGPSPYTNTATVSSAADPTPANDSSTAQTTVTIAQADLAITNSGPPFATRGASLSYTITVTNAGPDAAPSVVVADPTPAGLGFVSNSGDCTTAFPCLLGTIPSGGNRTISATFSVPAGQDVDASIVNTASVSSAAADSNPANDSDTATALFGAYYTLVPCRLVDTRTPGQAPALQPGEERSFVFSGAPCGIPVGAAALSVNLTVTAATAPGNVRLFPADVTAPLVSTINFTAGLTRANNAIVGAAADGSVGIKVKNASAGTVELILDVNGYFE